MHKVLANADAALKERGADYGPVDESAARIADLWTTWLGKLISGSDVMMMLLLMKVARLAESKDHTDSVVDIAGYAACYADVVGLNGMREV